MNGRLIAIGDIHGCHVEFAELLARLALTRNDRLILVGDLINRGPDSNKVIDLAREAKATCLLGNHELRLSKYRRTSDKKLLKEGDSETYANLRESDWAFIAEMPRLLQESGRLEIVHGAHSKALGDSVRFHYSDGHTPGLMLSEIVGPTGHGGLVFCADLIPGRPWVHLPVTMGYDRNAELLIDEKRAFLEDKLARDVHLFFTHDTQCALARVTRDAKGRFGTEHEVAELHARALAA